MELSTLVIFLSVLWGFVLADIFDQNFFSDDEEEYDGTKIAEAPFSSLLIKCDRSEGVCIQAVACPWDRVLIDPRESCLEVNSDYVCCKVAQVRMPDDLFNSYGI